MTADPSPGRHTAGWASITAGKVGSLLLLWLLLTSADTSPLTVVGHVDAVVATIGAFPLLATTLGMVATGLWLLLGSEGRPRTDGN